MRVLFSFSLSCSPFSNYSNEFLQICVALENLWWNVNENQIENQTSPYSIVMVSGNECLLISLTEEGLTQVLPIVFTIKKCEVGNKIWRHSPISFKHVPSLQCCSLILTSPHHTPMKFRCPIKKSNRITPAYRRWMEKMTEDRAKLEISVKGQAKWQKFAWSSTVASLPSRFRSTSYIRL